MPTTHGLSRSVEYGIWRGMKARCLLAYRSEYPNYGARGIGVCKEWMDFASFYAAMGPRPSPGHSLERRDNNGAYSPENCYWATRAQQARNRRSNWRISYLGKTMVLEDWATEAQLPRHVLKHRLLAGWAMREAMTTPPRHQKNSSP